MQRYRHRYRFLTAFGLLALLLWLPTAHANLDGTCGVDTNTAYNRSTKGFSNTSQYSQFHAFAALKADGSLKAWGHSSFGGTGAPTDTGYVRVASNRHAFAALKADGSIKAWGGASYGGSGAPTDSGYVSIASTYQGAFAALKADGSITAWGAGGYGGTGAPTGTGYTHLWANNAAFAALKADGSITVWGDITLGGSGAPTGTGYVSIASTGFAFVALKADGSLKAWGSSTLGGSGAPTDSGYVSVAATTGAFAALKADGSIKAWGSSTGGGTGAPTGTGYVSIAANYGSAFAALKADGSITAWGGSTTGGSDAPTDSGYIQISSNHSAFAALKADGSIRSWGAATSGGTGAPMGASYVNIASSLYSFAALKADGSIKAWGGTGGSGAPTDSGYVSIASNDNAFAAMKADGSITVWGDSTMGGSGAPTGSGYVSINGVGKTCFNALSPLTLDTNTDDDNDGVSDVDEALVGTNPIKAETINGIPDGSLDSDGDGISNGDESDETLSVPTDTAPADGNPDILTRQGSLKVTTCGVDTNRTYNANPRGYNSKPYRANWGTFAAMKADGSIKEWGQYVNNPTYDYLEAPTDSGYVSLLSSVDAFAALKADGSIKAWGFPSRVSGAPTDSGYVRLFSNYYAFVALKADGSITAWGESSSGGGGAPTDKGYLSIAATQGAFAALKADGSIRSWGANIGTGGTANPPTDNGYVSIWSTSANFYAMKADGSLSWWGGVNSGGPPAGTGYVSVTGSTSNFVALKADGSITTWGQYANNGAYPSYQNGPTDSGYVSIAATNNESFAALKADGSITAWGFSNSGGTGAPTDNGYVSIAANGSGAFAALKADGSITAWGLSGYGGSGAPTDSGYVSIASNHYAFAALKADGSITAWGLSGVGGAGAPTDSGYVSIMSTNSAFAALKADGSITTWGSSTYGGTGGPTDSGYVSINGVTTDCFNALSPLTTAPTLTLAATAATAAEGNSGTTAYTFTVTRAVNTAGATTVDWAVTGSGASPVNAADFGGTLPSGTVSFAAGDTSKVISVLVTGDTSVEPDETFSVTLTNPSGGATLLTATATGTIQNDDVSSPLSVQTPPAQTATTGQAKTGNAATELNPTGGVAPYDYSNGNADPACSAPGGATLLPVGSGFGVTSSTGVYSYTAPSSAGTYYYCIAVSDSTAPTAQRVVTAYTLTVTPSAPEKVLEYSIRRSLDGRYHVYMRPTTTPTINRSLTGQITVKVPSLSGSNRFVVADVVNPTPPVEWSQTSRVDAPSENPVADYLSFTFTPGGTQSFTWQAGVELEVFSFINANARGCSGLVSVMEDNDPFNQPFNSANNGPGNQFTNLGWGSPTDNNYLGIYGSAVDCSSTNQPPVITSNGGGDTATLTHSAGITTVTTVTATDADNDTLTYSLNGGADAAKFTIDSSTGVLSFLTTPLYGGFNGEVFSPAGDSDGNNIYEVIVQVSDGMGGTDTQQLSITLTPSSLTLTLSVWLQGPYNSSTGLMNDDLRRLGFIPSTQPYTMAPFAYQGTETVDSGLLALTGTTAVVDWVLVELRQSANPATAVARQAALVRRDGSVVNSSGSTTLSFNGVSSGSYYVAIRHRNHLGVMTSTPLTLGSTNTLIDFKTTTLATQGTHSRLVSGSSTLLWAGDVNKSNYIIANGPNNDANDLLGSVLMASQNVLLNGNYNLQGYKGGDINMDGSTLFAGPGNDTNLLVGNVLLHPNNSTFSGNYVIGGGAAVFTPTP